MGKSNLIRFFFGLSDSLAPDRPDFTPEASEGIQRHLAQIPITRDKSGDLDSIIMSRAMAIAHLERARAISEGREEQFERYWSEHFTNLYERLQEDASKGHYSIRDYFSHHEEEAREAVV